MKPTTFPFSSATYIKVSCDRGNSAESVELSSDHSRAAGGSASLKRMSDERCISSMRARSSRPAARTSLVGAGVRQAHELSMQTQVAAQLGVKTERDDAALPHRHRMTVVIRHHVYVSG